MSKKKDINPRQKKFVEEYLACGDTFEAAVAAGYRSETAASQGERLLKDPEVQRYRRELEQRLFEGMGITSAWIGRRLVEIVDRCMQATPHMSRNPDTKQREPDGTWEFDPATAMRALHELDAHMASLRKDSEEEEELSFEEWLRAQGKESGF